MILLLVTMDEKDQCRPFSCQISQLEAAFEILNTIASNGDVVISADLLENGHYMPLPIEAFDGKPIRPHIEKLVVEWQTLLTVPVDSKHTHQQLHSACFERLKETYQIRISRLELAIKDTHSRLQQMPRTVYWESSCVRLEGQLIQYRDQLERGTDWIPANLRPFCHLPGQSVGEEAMHTSTSTSRMRIDDGSWLNSVSIP